MRVIAGVREREVLLERRGSSQSKPQPPRSQRLSVQFPATPIR
jgi:hypothetical protein